jgi:hypothetical protein
MTRRLNTLAALGLIGLLVTVVVALPLSPSPAPPPAPAAGDSVLDRELRRGAQLEEDDCLVLRSLRAKEQVTEAVIRRRFGLLEGAAALRALDATRPAHLRRACGGYRAGSEEEQYCRRMVDWVSAALNSRGADPSRALELEAELQDLLRRPDPLRLPDVSLERCVSLELHSVPAGVADGPGG